MATSLALVLAAACTDAGITPPANLHSPALEAAVVRESPQSRSAAESRINVGPLTNGANAGGTISATSQVDTWTFTAAQGQYLLVAIGETGGSSDFTPWIRLLDPNGATIANASNAAAAQIGMTAPLTGTYQVLVGSADLGNDGTGSYTLMAAQLSGAFTVSPGDQGGALTNGANHAGTIEVGDVDLWSISANQGDAITVALGEVTGSADYAPWIRLIGANGALLASTSGAAVAQFSVNAPVAGTYTVVVSTADGGNDGTGTYTITTANAPGSLTISPGDNGGPAPIGPNVTGTLTVGDLDAFTFAANQGDYVMVAYGEVSGGADYAPWLRVYAPDGTLVSNSWNAAAAQAGFSASLTGTYTAVLSTADAGNDDSGDYNLTLVIAPGALTTSPGDQGGVMNNGATYSGNIFVGDLDAFSFSATQGDGVVVAVGEGTVSSDFSPWLRIVGPDGTVVRNAWSAAATQATFNATLTGTYTVVISTGDSGNDGTGDFNLSFARSSGAVFTSPGDEGGPATNGGNNAGTIGVGDIDVYTFNANQGLPFAVSIGEVSGSADFMPWIRVIAPDGVFVGNSWNSAAAQVSAFAQVSGTFVVVVSTADAGNDATGSYRLVLQKAGAFVTPPGDEGGAMTNGSIQTGTLVTGDLDRWTFQANQGDFIAASVGELTGTDLTPWIRLVSPSGALLGNTWAAVVAQLSAIAPETGNYTLAIGSADPGNDGVGTYNLTVAKGPGAFVVSPGDQGGAISNGVQNGAIAAGGDLDMWTITATQGNQLSLTVSEVTGTTDYTPWIRLVAPDGKLYGNNWDASSATLNVTAPLTGTYTVILGTADPGNDATGTYTLSITGANMVPNPHFVESRGDLKAFMSPIPGSYGLEGGRAR